MEEFSIFFSLYPLYDSKYKNGLSWSSDQGYKRMVNEIINDALKMLKFLPSYNIISYVNVVSHYVISYLIIRFEST